MQLDAMLQLCSLYKTEHVCTPVKLIERDQSRTDNASVFACKIDHI